MSWRSVWMVCAGPRTLSSTIGSPRGIGALPGGFACALGIPGVPDIPLGIAGGGGTAGGSGA